MTRKTLPSEDSNKTNIWRSSTIFISLINWNDIDKNCDIEKENIRCNRCKYKLKQWNLYSFSNKKTKLKIQTKWYLTLPFFKKNSFKNKFHWIKMMAFKQSGQKHHGSQIKYSFELKKEHSKIFL